MNKLQGIIIASGIAGNYGYEKKWDKKQNGGAIYIPKRHKFKKRNKR